MTTAASTRMIPREKWVEFFNTFSVRHQRWLVTIEMIGSEIGAQTAGRSLRFEGINADLKDSEDRITIDLGETGNETLVHTIEHPVRVWVGESTRDLGTFETVDIESVDGVKTLIRFLAGVRPEGA